jgi:VWFA-related protein
MKLLKLLSCLAVFALLVGAQDHRSLCLFLDLNMSAADQSRAREAAIKFIEERTTPTDQITIMTFTTEVKVVQDFTGDRDLLVASLRGIAPYAPRTAATPDSDNRLQALQTAATMLGATPGKKQLVYFAKPDALPVAGDLDRVMATVAAAVRANVAFYPVNVPDLPR